MYTDRNFKTKKELKAAVAAGETVYVYSPGPFPAPQNGPISLEGPHYPAPHSWYANADIADGKIVRVK